MMSVDRVAPMMSGDAFFYRQANCPAAQDDHGGWVLEVYRSGAAELRFCGVIAARVRASEGLTILDTNREAWDRAFALIALLDTACFVPLDDFVRARLMHELARWIDRQFD